VFYSLRHISLRIWATVLLGGLISLWILPVFHPHIGLEWSLVPALVIMIVVFMAVGWFSNRLGISAVERLIREATTWERVGAYRGAEEAFNKATTVLDSFLLSPLVKRKESAKLAARLARFYLARTDKNHSSETFIIAYLKSHPEDEEVAENWLQQVESHGGLKTDHYELAFRIGNAQPENTVIQHLLARFYLSEGRTDFSALQTYRQVLNEDKNAAVGIVKDLATLFLRDGRADEWALRIYLQAFRLSSERHKLLRGVAACVHWIHETERTTHLLQQARKLLVSLDEMQLKKLRAGFNPPGLEPTEPKISAQLKVGITLWKVVRQTGSSLFNLITSAAFELIGRARDVINLIKRSRRPKLILEWTMITVMAIGVITLMVNTTSHLIRTKRALYEKEKTTEIVVTDPFTLQVAAYLKPQDAERYVKYLKTKKLDAFWIKRRGKRKVLYQVRVSHFANKASARAYGKSLKAQGIIDDFYVANYEQP
jgi:tetratricopeptide (TPR) repeat protein